MDDAVSTGSADDALEIEQVDECEYEGRLGGFLSENCTVSLRFYCDGALDGLVRQRKKQQLRGLTLLSTSSRKRQRVRDDVRGEDTEDNRSVLCGFIQGRWMRRGDGRVSHFQAMKRRGHVDRQTLQCRAEFTADAAATGTWRLVSNKKHQQQKSVKKEVQEDDDATESDDYYDKKEDGDRDDDSVIENVFEWKRVDHTANGEGTKEEMVVSEDPLAVYPLAPGTYHFRGFTTTYIPDPATPHQRRTKQQKKKKMKAPEPPPRDECFVTMELRADGTLVGKSREVVYPQNCVIRGKWEVGRLRYVLEYKVRGAVGLFKYSARVVESRGEKKGKEEAAAVVRVLQGKWRNIDDNEHATPGYTGGRGQLELVCVYRSNPAAGSVKREGSNGDDDEGGSLKGKAGLPIVVDDSVEIAGGSFANVFTTGRYMLKGKAVDDDGYEYESRLELELFGDGTMRGTCQELVYQQVQQLQGNWTRTSIQYELEYAVKKEVGRYWYQGRFESDGLVLHGSWCNMELLLKVDTPRVDRAVATPNYRGEKGMFSYAILEATRRWSHTSHSDFPKAFRDRRMHDRASKQTVGLFNPRKRRVSNKAHRQLITTAVIGGSSLVRSAIVEPAKRDAQAAVTAPDAGAKGVPKAERVRPSTQAATRVSKAVGSEATPSASSTPASPTKTTPSEPEAESESTTQELLLHVVSSGIDLVMAAFFVGGHPEGLGCAGDLDARWKDEFVDGLERLVGCGHVVFGCVGVGVGNHGWRGCSSVGGVGVGSVRDGDSQARDRGEHGGELHVGEGRVDLGGVWKKELVWWIANGEVRLVRFSRWASSSAVGLLDPFW